MANEQMGALNKPTPYETLQNYLRHMDENNALAEFVKGTEIVNTVMNGVGQAISSIVMTTFTQTVLSTVGTEIRG